MLNMMSLKAQYDKSDFWISENIVTRGTQEAKFLSLGDNGLTSANSVYIITS